MLRALTITLFLSLLQASAFAQDKAEGGIAYYPFDPDIVTNFVTPTADDLGYIRVSIQLMLTDKKYIPVIEHHEPLLLDIIVTLLSRENSDKHKSLTGREEVRLKIVTELQEVMRKETGQEVIKDVLYSKYLYHGAS